MEELIRIGILYQVYGPFLTKNQQSLMEDYYYNDLSLQEIADNKEISKQAVSDQINRAVKKMQNAENILGIIKKRETIRDYLDPLIEALDRGEDISPEEELITLKKLKEVLLLDGKEG